MYCGDCDAAIAKASAAVTHVQSQSQKLVLAMKGWVCCVLICHEQKKWSFGGWTSSSSSPLPPQKIANTLNKNDPLTLSAPLRMVIL